MVTVAVTIVLTLSVVYSAFALPVYLFRRGERGIWWGNEERASLSRRGRPRS